MANVIRPWDDNPTEPEKRIQTPGEIFDQEVTTVEELAAKCTLMQNVYSGAVDAPIAFRREAEINGQKVSLGITVPCGKGLHKFPTPAIACRHVIDYDLDNLKSIVRMPANYYLCGDCFRLLEKRSHRLQLPHICGLTCWRCIDAKILEMKRRDPTRYVDKVLKTS